jgi:hypothetical protein
MPWGVRLTAETQEQLFDLPMREGEVVSFNLFRLAEDPITLSTSSASPLPLGQEYTFRYSPGGTELSFTISFRYHEHWEMLLIVRIEREVAGP